MTETLFGTDPTTAPGEVGCADCGQPIPHRRHRYSGQAPHRCPECRSIHTRAVQRASHNGTSVDAEKARVRAPGDCDICGEPLESYRRKRHPECQAKYQRAYHRAHKYGTELGEELRRQTSAEGACLVCGGLPSHINRDFCQACIDVGARKVYQRAMTYHGASHDDARTIASATECANIHCRRPLDRSRKWDSGQLSGAHIDHDHRTGRIRGVLCGTCNRALGHLNDDPMRALGLLEYLIGGRAIVAVDDRVRSVGFGDPVLAEKWRAILAMMRVSDGVPSSATIQYIPGA